MTTCTSAAVVATVSTPLGAAMPAAGGWARFEPAADAAAGGGRCTDGALSSSGAAGACATGPAGGG